MTSRFEEALKQLDAFEGKEANDAPDKGGHTKYGISSSFLAAHPELGLGVDDVTYPRAVEIYRVYFWGRLRCDDLPHLVAHAVFDWGVNSGTGIPSKAIQRIVGTKVDGSIGPKTLTAVNLYIDSGKSDRYLARLIMRARLDFFADGYREDSRSAIQGSKVRRFSVAGSTDPLWAIKGHLRRVMDLDRYLNDRERKDVSSGNQGVSINLGSLGELLTFRQGKKRYAFMVLWVIADALMKWDAGTLNGEDIQNYLALFGLAAGVAGVDRNHRARTEAIRSANENGGIQQ